MEDTVMGNPFWDGFEKQAGLARFVGRVGAKATGAARNAKASVRHVAGSPGRFLKGVKGSYHNQRAKQMNMPLDEYKAKYLTNVKSKVDLKSKVSPDGPKAQPKPKTEANAFDLDKINDGKIPAYSKKHLRNAALVGAGVLGGSAISSKRNQGH